MARTSRRSTTRRPGRRSIAPPRIEVVVTPTRDLPSPTARTGHRIAPPTGHAVCRSCGRIVRVALLPEEVGLLEALADHRPDGWRVEGASFSVTGLCATCLAEGAR